MLDPKKQTPKPGKPVYSDGPDDPEAYYAVLVPETEGGYSVLFPDVPGCVTQGEDLHSALAMAEEAVTGWLDATYDDGIPVPAARGIAAIIADEAWAKENH